MQKEIGVVLSHRKEGGRPQIKGDNLNDQRGQKKN